MGLVVIEKMRLLTGFLPVLPDSGGAVELPDSVALVSPLTEHSAVLEVWAPLTRGGALVILEPGADSDAEYFVGLLAEAGATRQTKPFIY